jgi:hypothetical protein
MPERIFIWVALTAAVVFWGGFAIFVDAHILGLM